MSGFGDEIPIIQAAADKAKAKTAKRIFAADKTAKNKAIQNPRGRFLAGSVPFASNAIVILSLKTTI